MKCVDCGAEVEEENPLCLCNECLKKLEEEEQDEDFF